MRYEYTITKEGGEAEIMEEMSWKKLFKKLLLKYPKFSGWCTYFNRLRGIDELYFIQSPTALTFLFLSLVYCNYS